MNDKGEEGNKNGETQIDGYFTDDKYDENAEDEGEGRNEIVDADHIQIILKDLFYEDTRAGSSSRVWNPEEEGADAEEEIAWCHIAHQAQKHWS